MDRQEFMEFAKKSAVMKVNLYCTVERLSLKETGSRDGNKIF
jgi:hypothetical protein